VQAEDYTTVSGQKIRKHPEGHLTLTRQERVRTQTDQDLRTQTRVTIEQEAKTYRSDPIFTTLQLCGAQAGRSFVKSAYTLAVSSGVKPKVCVEARAYCCTRTVRRVSIISTNGIWSPIDPPIACFIVVQSQEIAQRDS
jgi:hypothetical protein